MGLKYEAVDHINNTDVRFLSIQPGTKLSDIERIIILETLKLKNFNRTNTARVLGIGIRTLQRKIKIYSTPCWKQPCLED